MTTLSAAARAFLEEKRFAVLATINKDGSPQLTVMWYLLEGDEIMFNTAAGRVKPRNIERDQRVSLAVEDGYRFVRVDGTVRTITDRDTTQADIRRLAVRYNGEAAAQRAMEQQFSKETRISYRLRVRRVYARGF